MICDSCGRRSSCGASVRCSNTGNKFHFQTSEQADFETLQRFANLTGYSVKIEDGRIFLMAGELILFVGIDERMKGKHVQALI